MTAQQTYHAYLGGEYQGVYLATAEQLAAMGLTAGHGPTQDPAVVLAAEREGMTCTPMQGIIALGEADWNQVIAYRDTYATWVEKVIIDGAQVWVRNSQNIQFFQYLLNFTDEQVDALFRTAAGLDA